MAKVKRKKGTDKWKLKKWYEVVTPDYLEGKVIGEIISHDPDNIPGRIIKVPISDITGQISPESLYSAVNLRAVRVDGSKVVTETDGYEMAFSYLKSLARKRRSVIHNVLDIELKDGQKVRVKSMLVTLKKVSHTVKKNLRKAFDAAIIEEVKKMRFPDFVNAVVKGTLVNKVFNDVNRVNPVETVVVKKFERL